MSRLTIATSAQADASGGATFDGFGAPGTGTAWVVTAAVPLAPGTASFQAWRTTEVWASWLGSAAGGPLLVTGSQRLIVKGTSLAKTAIYRCVLTGQSMSEATAQGVSVAPISSSTFTQSTVNNVTTVHILPVVDTVGILSVKVKLLGTTTAVAIVPSTATQTYFKNCKIGFVIWGTPTNTGKHIYLGDAAGGVSTSDASIPAGATKLVGAFSVAFGNAVTMRVSGKTGDYVNVWAA